MGCWLDFTSFIPLLVILAIRQYLYPYQDDIKFDVHVMGVLLLTAFASGITWVQLHRETLIERTKRIDRINHSVVDINVLGMRNPLVLATRQVELSTIRGEQTQNMFIPDYTDPRISLQRLRFIDPEEVRFQAE